jgi:hypothetical protein
MKKIIMLLSIVALFSFVAKAQEDNTFKAAKEISVSKLGLTRLALLITLTIHTILTFHSIRITARLPV